jgi:hypothetical protein
LIGCDLSGGARQKLGYPRNFWGSAPKQLKKSAANEMLYTSISTFEDARRF